MFEFTSSLFQKYGAGALVGIVFGMIVVWIISHNVAQSGEQVSVLWGMVEYTKQRVDLMQLDLNKLAPPAASTNPADVVMRSDGPHSTESTGNGMVMADGPLFGIGSPFPRGFDVVKPGTRLSVAMSAYPNGHFGLSNTDYDIPLSHSMFSRAVYYFWGLESDPEVYSISFFCEGATECDRVRSAALAAFGSDGVRSNLVGVLRWEDISGFEVCIDRDSYTIKKRAG